MARYCASVGKLSVSLHGSSSKRKLLIDCHVYRSKSRYILRICHQLGHFDASFPNEITLEKIRTDNKNSLFIFHCITERSLITTEACCQYIGSELYLLFRILFSRYICLMHLLMVFNRNDAAEFVKFARKRSRAMPHPLKIASGFHPI